MKKIIIGSLGAFAFLLAGSAIAAYDFSPMISQTNAAEVRMTDQRAYMSAYISSSEEEGYDTTEAESLYATAEVTYAELQSEIDEFQGMLEDASADELAAPSAELKAKRLELMSMHAEWKSEMHSVHMEMMSLDEEAV